MLLLAQRGELDALDPRGRRVEPAVAGLLLIADGGDGDVDERILGSRTRVVRARLRADEGARLQTNLRPTLTRMPLHEQPRGQAGIRRRSSIVGLSGGRPGDLDRERLRRGCARARPRARSSATGSGGCGAARLPRLRPPRLIAGSGGAAETREHALRVGRVGMVREPLLEDGACLTLASARLERGGEEEARLRARVVNRPRLGGAACLARLSGVHARRSPMP